MKTTGQYSVKLYKCRGCGATSYHGTNHWGAIYPWCSGCKSQAVMDCCEPLPEGYDKPEEWKMVTLGDIIRH